MTRKKTSSILKAPSVAIASRCLGVGSECPTKTIAEIFIGFFRVLRVIFASFAAAIWLIAHARRTVNCSKGSESACTSPGASA
jgi:hypothetical protein